MLEPRKQDCQTRSAIMDWDDDGDRSLMEWYEEKKTDRNRKRKRKSSHRSRRQSGVTLPTNITFLQKEITARRRWEENISWWVLRK